MRREYPTGIGPVDLLYRDATGAAVAVEVKRRGDIDGVEQLARYVERLNLDGDLRPVRGVFVAQVVRPQARVLAEARGLGWVEVDYDELRGLKPDELTPLLTAPLSAGCVREFARRRRNSSRKAEAGAEIAQIS